MQLQKEQHQPFDSLEVVIKDETASVQEGPKSPESEWVISIRQKLNHANQDDDAVTWSKLCIYRVPQYLREVDDKAYIPQLVSLGPYHHNKRRLRNMDPHKWRAVYHILKRTNQDIKLYLDAVKELEERARGCYEGPICLSSNEFVEMMVLDGCFILELFRGAAEGFTQLGYSRNDPIFAMRCSMYSIQRDMIMLENQIPLFVLDRLFGLQLGNPDLKGMVGKLAFRYFDPLMPTDEQLSLGHTASFDPLAEVRGVHCLDVFRKRLLLKWRSTSSNRVADKRRQQLIHCVTELREAGINFKKRKTGKFWDIKFENGVLEIPRLLIHDGTKSIFLNLMAFEQRHSDCTNYITSYLIFMDNLINSPEDVSFLHYCGIIEHWLGNDAEVAELFNRLCQEVVFDLNDSYLSPLSEQVNLYCARRWNTWRATLTHKYFNNPWTIISFVAALMLLFLTFAQTFYGVFGYYRPP